jgi:rfaE bifunctional protein nucleotidyltransferase chain/domain
VGRSLDSKIIPLGELKTLSEKLRSQGKKIVTTNGCFDILHLGHIQYLQEAKSLGDILIVGINSDSSVKTIKTPDRPIFPEKVRARQVAGLESVDYLAIFSESTPENFISLVKPAVHVKGGDYKPDQLPERKVVEASGGQIKILKFVDGYSTTKILEKLKV